jgi:signal transduction histidine kinase
LKHGESADSVEPLRELLPIDGMPYQVVAIAFYDDSAHEQLDRVFGFMVNLRWAREHYFSELIRQSALLAARSPGIEFALTDGRGATVARGPGPGSFGGSASQQFSQTFFDPALAIVNTPPDLPPESWTLTVRGGGDAFVLASVRSARQAVVLIICGAAFLWAGLLATLVATRKNVELEALRWDFVSSITHELKSPLSTVRAIGEMLAENQTRPKVDVKRYGEPLVRQGHRLTRLVTNIVSIQSGWPRQEGPSTMSLCRFEGDRGRRCNRCNAARQIWQMWHAWQSNPRMFLNLKVYRGFESLSLRQFTSH